MQKIVGALKGFNSSLPGFSLSDDTVAAAATHRLQLSSSDAREIKKSFLSSSSSSCSLPKAGEITKPTNERIEQLFDWFTRHEWAEEYYSDVCGNIKVGIVHISEADAVRQMIEADFGDVVEWCSFSEPTPGKYSPSADRQSRVMEPRELAKPGITIRAGQQCALYSGSLSDQLPNDNQTGLSVGHLFSSADGDGKIYIETSQIGSLVHKVDEVYLQPNEGCRTTADLSFLAIDDSVCLTRNTVYIDGKTFQLKLYKGELRVGMKVSVVDHCGNTGHGQISISKFYRKSDRLYNTLAITDMNRPEADHKITGECDSGALVLYADEQGEDVIYVLGIVTGVWDVDYPPTARGKTIACRLREILLAIGRDPIHCHALRREAGSIGVAGCGFFDAADFQ